MSKIKSILADHFSNFSFFFSYIEWRLLAVAGLGLLIGFADALGLSMFLPILQLAGDVGSAENSSVHSHYILNFFERVGVPFDLTAALIFTCIIFVLKGGVNFLLSVYKVTVAQLFIAKVRLRLVKLFQEFSFEKYVLSDMGNVQNILSTETGRVNSAFIAYTGIIQASVLVFVYMLGAFFLNWLFASMIVVGGVVVNMFFIRVYGKTRSESKSFSHNNAVYYAFIRQYLNAYKYLKATGLIRKFTNNIESSILDIEITNKRMGNLAAIVQAAREPLMIIVVSIVILIHVEFLSKDLTTILVSLFFFYRALGAFMIFQSKYTTFLSLTGSIKNINDFTDGLVNNKEGNGAIDFNTLNQALTFDHVYFDFTNRKVLKNVNIQVKKNSSIALVGESGSGKTTIINLLCGLLSPTHGNIMVDDVRLSDLNKASFQKRIGYITQEPVIFSDTLFNNVTLWSERNEENISKFNEVIRKASLFNFVNSNEDRENVLLGDGGLNLSGGQRQRISIARELFKDIDIMILDEATSALDSETEKEIQKNLEGIMGDYTVIIIAHRLSTVRNVDTIYLICDGEIEDSGPFDILYMESEKFKKMVELQEVH